MIVEVKVPQLSESVSEATLLSWHKKEGDAVARDENLIDVETDKVVMELPAPAAGVLVKIIKADGGMVTSGEVIAQIDTEGKGAAVAPATAAPAAAKRHLLHAICHHQPRVVDQHFRQAQRHAPRAQGQLDCSEHGTFVVAHHRHL